MCGICGIYSYRGGEPADTRLLAAMTASMEHRGPDDQGSHLDGTLGLGMRRLSIIDLEGGHQPLSGEDGTMVAVVNGEIYNFRELRRELEARGHTFRTRSDCEVVVHGFEEWGDDCLVRLNGMFGLAVWDARSRRLVLARDPFGVKPLYYRVDDRRLLFGSEVRAILADSDVERAVDHIALDQFMRFTFVPSPRTLFAGIGKLRPGYKLICDADGCREERFDRTEPHVARPASRQAAIAETRDLVERAIERQLVADVPVGVLLSGGVDSSAITAITCAAQGAPVDTFTVGFEEGFVENELDEARRVAQRHGCRHHDVVMTSREFADFLPMAIKTLEEPIATPSTLPFFRLCQLAKESVKVVLTGQGADEPFAGYDRVTAARFERYYRGLPRIVRDKVARPLADRLPRNERLHRAVDALDIADPADRLAAVYSVISAAERTRLYGEQLAQVPWENPVTQWQQAAAGLDPVTQMLHVDARFSLPDSLLLYCDKISMAVSLEARVPFLDLPLMHYAESLPPGLKLRGRTRKYVLKEAVRGWVSPQALQRPKVGFRTPVDEWFRAGTQRELTDRLLAGDSVCRRYLSAAEVGRMIEAHRLGARDYKRILYSLLTFELWHAEFMTGPRTR
jgi:asparagine synthase (glutamine-hydrolysing)